MTSGLTAVNPNIWAHLRPVSSGRDVPDGDARNPAGVVYGPRESPR